MTHGESVLDRPEAARTAFAAELRKMREDAGNPSFRRMAEKSGCISHATLHEAASGSRFPSWETTREFAKACDQSEDLWRARWEAARGEAPGVSETADAGPVPGKRRWWLLAAVVVLVAAVVSTVVAVTRPDAPVSAAPAPIPPTPRVHGDASKFVADVTVPDSTPVKLGQTVLKVWEIQNVGTVPWHARYLQRMDLPAAPGTCHTPDRVLIGDTAPGETVMISVSVQAPDAPVRCWIGWKMVDEHGYEFFSSSRPVYVLINAVK